MCVPAPDPIPPEWFTRGVTLLPAALASAMSYPLAWHHAFARLGAQALARVDPDELRMHRLTQAIVRGYLSSEQSAASRRAAEAIVAACSPGDGRTPSTWPGWARLLPHLIFLNPELSTSPGLRELAIGATWYLFRRGDPAIPDSQARPRDVTLENHPITLRHAGHQLTNLALICGVRGVTVC